MAGSVLGAVAAAFDIADMIYSWVTTDPNLTKAEEILQKISDEILLLTEEQTWLKRIEKEICSELDKLDVDISIDPEKSSPEENIDAFVECQICMEMVRTF